MVNHEYKLLQKVQFWKVGNMQIFLVKSTHLLTRSQEEKFEKVFLQVRELPQ